ncbi:MAG: molybdenum cofactor biosynthesis protein [Planctomycetes bacterium RBG_16_64_12]|nr:MAG: molybdenum cofactor biosynthesis protein [Planctomycetes bacterium RBG_16_64_12]
MRGFARRTTVADALAWLDGQTSRLPQESAPLTEAAGRVLAREIISEVDVQGFTRSMMDGFAVRAGDTLGASPYNRLALEVIGASLPGRPFEGSVSAGESVRIMTGAPLPEGADAVLPVELVELEGRRILAQGEVSPGKHVGRIGEDIAAGTTVLPQGRLLRPQDIGVLASIGVADVPAVCRPRVRIVVTGDELLPAGSKPEGYRIVDSNGPMLAALVRRDGGVPLDPGIVPDEPAAILDAMRSEADVVLVSGGSSVGQEDHAPSLLKEHGRLPIHGIAMRPSSPTGMGVLDGRLVFLLPGNPVSCLCAYDFFAGRAIRAQGGRSTDWPYRRITAPLRRKIVSTVGRLDYLRVRLVWEKGSGTFCLKGPEGAAHKRFLTPFPRVDPLAIGGASVLSSTTRADGFVLVPPDSEGYPPGAEVEVFLYD